MIDETDAVFCETAATTNDMASWLRLQWFLDTTGLLYYCPLIRPMMHNAEVTCWCGAQRNTGQVN